MRHIQLVGIKGESGFEALRQMVRVAIRKLRQRPRIQEVTEVEDITALGVNAIPALVVNKEVIYEYKGTPAEYGEVEHLMESYLENRKKQVMKVLVPTDFSDNATNAMQFAVGLSKTQSVEITLLHISQPNIDTAGGVVIPTMIDFEQIKRDQLTQYIRSLNGAVTAEIKEGIKPELALGFPADEIVERSKSFDLIIMGTTGQGGILEKLFGSVSTKVAQDAQCPVWLIPPNSTFETVNDLAYACTYPEKDEEVFDKVASFFPPVQTRYHLLHVATTNGEPVEAVLEQWNSTFGELAYQTSNIRSDSVWEGIYSYADIEDVDLVVLVTKRRNFWNSLTHSSKTKEMILHARKPLMVFHVD